MKKNKQKLRNVEIHTCKCGNVPALKYRKVQFRGTCDEQVYIQCAECGLTGVFVSVGDCHSDYVESIIRAKQYWNVIVGGKR